MGIKCQTIYAAYDNIGESKTLCIRRTALCCVFETRIMKIEPRVEAYCNVQTDMAKHIICTHVDVGGFFFVFSAL